MTNIGTYLELHPSLYNYKMIFCLGRVVQSRSGKEGRELKRSGREGKGLDSRLSMMIRYHIPGDGDDPTHPNVFPMPGSSPHNLMLKNIQAVFPLPGDYLFRFKTRVENKSKCDLLHGYYGIVFEIVIFL